MKATDEQIILFYSKLLEIKKLAADARDLAAFLECPDSELVDILELLPDSITKHMDNIKVQVSFGINQTCMCGHPFKSHSNARTFCMASNCACEIATPSK